MMTQEEPELAASQGHTKATVPLKNPENYWKDSFTDGKCENK